MSMTKQKFAALEKLRERMEDRARQDVEAKRRAEAAPRDRANQAKQEMENEVATRHTMSEKLKGRGGAPTSASDQIVGRVLLTKQDQQVAKSVQAAAVAASALVQAVAKTAESVAKLREASIAKEKSKQSAGRFAEHVAMERLKRDEAELDDETEVQVMARFSKRKSGAGNE